MRSVRWWVLLTSAAAPTVLIGGWTVAATRQPSRYDSTKDTISSLAAIGAGDRWIMTTALFLVAICHVLTAAGLGVAAPAGRVLLAAGGVGTALVAAFPLGRGDTTTAHRASAAFAFAVLAAWPLFGFRRRPGTPWTLRPTVSVAAGVVLLALVGWFGVSLSTGTRVGLAERVAAGAQNIWPFVVALMAWRTKPRAQAGIDPPV
jgi:hypothetical membrane protein